MFKIDYPFTKEILACGAQLEANFCLTKKDAGFVTNNLGNLALPNIYEQYQCQVENTQKELKIKPKIITHDLHPEFNSTKFAQAIQQKNKGLKRVPIQHQMAHLASCLAENKLSEAVIGVVFDNAGVGTDGDIWGGEFFVGNLKNINRAACLRFNQADSTEGVTSSAAVFFDRLAKCLSLRERFDFEGQGLVELERIINRSSHVANKIYDYTPQKSKDMLVIVLDPIFAGIREDLEKDISKSIISAALHNTIIELTRDTCHKINQKEKLKKVVLTGTVFQSKTLLNRLKDLLTQDGLSVIEHRYFSCNDSNISFGQAALANQLC
ncbi:MAG: hypothetical protein JW714_00915 [Candidatus Omnitrophica bacterium]|nr:hypothetical protein [Candidatus Omnitrophota bacterium]